MPVYENFKHRELTSKILKAFYTVYNRLGYGFLEKVYENALVIELRKMGLRCEQQVPITVYYEGEVVGNFRADVLVEGIVIVELKAAVNLCAGDEAQLVHYLRATEIEVGLLLGFCEKPDTKRRVFENFRKKLPDRIN
ncbi:GxxExxY protein [Flaviaesturariibacter aridisoli]|uniref:GxxExxY protein n=1 Tax=Flaviaesturariibacter aridisoli TaxID=2545761 RepID=A0A4R4E4D4_9BACT|nr:GxxExxY protein [Flaviaesturariibacter aridisoli]TCZ74436.1 GxxExxY protein [Flaviaesturariibacter aridisoli]